MSDDLIDLYQRKVELRARTGQSNLAYNATFTEIVGVFLHAANLRHGTEGFISPPKEGMLRNFSPVKSDGFGRV
jgi:hypothetical protein